MNQALSGVVHVLLATEEPLDLAKVHDTIQKAHFDLAMIRWSSAWYSAIKSRLKKG